MANLIAPLPATPETLMPVNENIGEGIDLEEGGSLCVKLQACVHGLLELLDGFTRKLQEDDVYARQLELAVNIGKAMEKNRWIYSKVFSGFCTKSITRRGRRYDLLLSWSRPILDLFSCRSEVSFPPKVIRKKILNE